MLLLAQASVAGHRGRFGMPGMTLVGKPVRGMMRVEETSAKSVWSILGHATSGLRSDVPARLWPGFGGSGFTKW
jgi:hypothetical protein